VSSLGSREGIDVHDEEVEKLISRLAEEIMRERLSGGRSGTNPCCRVLHKNFSEVGSVSELSNLLKQCKLVFINFYSTYCPHCMLFDRVFRTVGAKYSDTALFIKVNVMSSPEIAIAYYVMGVPTTVAVVDGVEVNRVVGLVPSSTFEAFVKNVIESYPCRGE